MSPEPPATVSTAQTLRRLVWEVYLPWSSAALGRGMLIPVLPLYLKESGLSFTMVSVVLAAMGAGAVLGGLPAGGLAGRSGEDVLFAISILLMGVTVVALGITTAVIALVAFRLMYGAGSIGIRISGQLYITRTVAPATRGRAMAFMGGSARVAFFLGPLLGGFLADQYGFTTAFVVCGVVTASGIAPFVVSRRRSPHRATVPEAGRRPGIGDALRRHRRLLLLAGIGPALVMTVREGRNVVVPLVGDDLGLSPTAVGALVAIGTGADMLLFPLSGWLMDRFGRLYAIVPAFGLLGAGMLVLGFAGSAAVAVVAGTIMGVGNGMSSGTMLTLGSDLAPADAPGPFLAAFGMLQDTGPVIGPILVGWFADAAGLGASAIVLAAVMFVAIAWIVVVVGETSAAAARGRRGLIHPRTSR
ncbi:MAG: MFS transporter [Acidimicrobiales bacterium]|nr:MFS transporter [Acidimicrobiales bacterium]